MHDTGCLGLVHWDDPEGWNGERGGRRVQDGEHLYQDEGCNLNPDSGVPESVDCVPTLKGWAGLEQ